MSIYPAFFCRRKDKETQWCVMWKVEFDSHSLPLTAVKRKHFSWKSEAMLFQSQFATV